MREYFSELYGNDRVKTRLGAAIENETLPHAFLINGASGSGKRTLARELSAALNCECRHDASKPLPCHTCNNCRRIKEENFADIMRLKRGDGKATISVEEVRLFREDMYLSATESRHKIYIIEEADKLTVNAQNALLTILEEPPRNVFIILLCDSADRILTTIKSRTQSIAMERFDNAKLKKYLSTCDVSLPSDGIGEELDGILMSADGRIGRMLLLLSERDRGETKEQRKLTERIMRSMKNSVPYSELYKTVSELPSARAEFIEALELLTSAIRDITLIKFDPELNLLFYTSKEELSDAAKDLSTKRLLKIYEIIQDALLDATKNVSTSAIIADLGAKIRLI